MDSIQIGDYARELTPIIIEEDIGDTIIVALHPPMPPPKALEQVPIRHGRTQSQASRFNYGTASNIEDEANITTDGDCELAAGYDTDNTTFDADNDPEDIEMAEVDRYVYLIYWLIGWISCSG